MIDLKEMYDTTAVQLGQQYPYASFIAALKRVIRRVNIEGEKAIYNILLTGEGEWTVALGSDDTVIGSDTRLIGSSRWLATANWDSINYALQLPREYAKIMDVYEDDVLMKNVPYDVLKASSSDDLYYSCVNNRLYFNKDYNATEEMLRIRVRKDYPLPENSDTEYEGMPDMADAMLLNGVLSILYSYPNYRDDRLLQLSKTQFDEDLYAFNSNVMRIEPQEHQTPQYTY